VTTTRHIPLNPCDYCIFGQHRVWRRQSGLGNFPYMIVEAEGRCDPDVLRGAVGRCLGRHPVLAARLVLSPFRLRPAWRVDDDAAHLARSADRAVVFTDLSGDEDAAGAFVRCFEAYYRGTWYDRAGPQIRIEHYAMPRDRTRIVLRWPHYLMDAEGAHRLFAMLDDRMGDPAFAAGGGGSGPPAHDLAQRIGRAVGRRAEFRRKGIGSAARRPAGELPFRHATEFADAPRTIAYGVLHRHWSGRPVDDVRKRARSELPPGPALHARYLAAAVCRAQCRLYAERRVETGAFYVTFPMRVGASLNDASLLEDRPIFGNYLVAPTICVPADTAADRAVVNAALIEQIDAFLAEGGDLKQWALLKMAAMLHHWMYDMIFMLPLDVLRTSSGFSYYRAVEGPLRSIGGARVANVWGGGPTTTPPAWNPVFCSFGQHLNLSLTYSRPVISAELAARYAELIEIEMFASA